ncbi:hypothetical protein NDA18_002350 [Ustilago nuda]|nr:hypothetical protein NDA18_002350 [Ustilago nuda]
MPPKNDAAGPSSPPPPRTRKPGEVRSRSGCVTCKQRRKKCDEDFRVRHNGAMSCNRCADRGIHCQFSSSATPQREPSQQRATPYPTPSATPCSAAKAPCRAVRGPSATPAAYHANLPVLASSSAVPTNSAAEAPTASTSSWNNSAHFPSQHFAQHFAQKQQQFQNAAVFPGLQNSAVANQLAWMNQNAAALNRSAVRYNRPNIWPIANSNGLADTSATVTQHPAVNVAGQSNPVDTNTLFNLINGSNGAAAPNALQWNQGYSNSMDNIMLDDFVTELMKLTGPLVGEQGGASIPPTSDNTPSAGAQHASSPLDAQPASHSAHEPSRASSSATSSSHRHDTQPSASSAHSHSKYARGADNAPSPNTSSKSGNGKAATPARASNRYRKLLDSDAIESLLSKYSPIYERFWHATLMLLSNKKRQAAVDYLMSVIRSNKACRASVVVVCLAYHELVQRVRKTAQKTDEKQQGQQGAPLPSWTSVATDVLQKSKTNTTSEHAKSQTLMDMFPNETEESVRMEQGGAVDRANNGRSRQSHSNTESEDDDEDEEMEPEEDVSIVETHCRSGDRPPTSTSVKVSAERYGTQSRRNETIQRSGLTPGRNLIGKLSTVEDNIQEMDDPERDAFKGHKVEEYTVELWFDIAQAELQRSRDELTLDQELCAIINLRWACLCFAGAERARQLTEELGKVMQREGIDLDHAREEEKKGSFVSVMLLTAVYTDVLDTVSDRGKRTHVAIREPGAHKPLQLTKQRRANSMADAITPGPPDKDEPFFGRISLISLELLTCFKMISDLAADVWGPISSTVANPTRPSEDEVAERSREIERKVMSLPPWSDPNTSSSLRVRAFALQEIWRQTARLYLLQAVHRRGSLHPELQNILHEIIRLAKMMKIQSFSPTAPIFTSASSHRKPSVSAPAQPRPAPSNYIGGLRSSDTSTGDLRDANHPDPLINATIGMEDLSHSLIAPNLPTEEDPETAEEEGPAPFQMWLDVASWEMCTVWFLCSTVALTRQDRQFCIHHLESLGLEKANRDNLQVVRDYWAKLDSSGHTVDWFDFVKSTGRSVILAF